MSDESMLGCLAGHLRPECVAGRQIREKESLTMESKVCREMRKVKSTAYTKTDFEQIAIAIGTAVKPVEDLEAKFEAAALVVSIR